MVKSTNKSNKSNKSTNNNSTGSGSIGWLIGAIFILFILFILYYFTDLFLVDCVGSWGEFGECSETCGTGTQSRTYSVSVPMQNGGQECETADGSQESQECNTQACPSNLSYEILDKQKDGYKTIRIKYQRPNFSDQRNIFRIYGTKDKPLQVPGGFQVDPPFGTTIGGVHPDFFPLNPDSEFDSWLTVGMTDASNPNAIAASPGLGQAMESWTEDNPFSTEEGSIWWMNLQDGPKLNSGPITIAQITIPINNKEKDLNFKVNLKGYKHPCWPTPCKIVRGEAQQEWESYEHIDLTEAMET